MKTALGWAVFLWLLACSCSAPGDAGEVVGRWSDASHRPITLTLAPDGGAGYEAPTRRDLGAWNFEADGKLRYRWLSGVTVTAPFEVTDGGDTLVTTAWDEILTMVRQ